MSELLICELVLGAIFAFFSWRVSVRIQRKKESLYQNELGDVIQTQESESKPLDSEDSGGTEYDPIDIIYIRKEQGYAYN